MTLYFTLYMNNQLPHFQGISKLSPFKIVVSISALFFLLFNSHESNYMTQRLSIRLPAEVRRD